MKKIILSVIVLAISLVCITGCNHNNRDNKEDALKFKTEYESLNGNSNEKFTYRTINIDLDNPIVYSSAEDIVKRIENKETFVVYFGAAECPWCRSVIEVAINEAKENNIDTIYYVDIWEGFHNEILRDTYELKDGKAVIKTKGSDAYYKLLDYFDNVLSDYELTDTNNKKVSIGEKRIYAPNIISVKNGEAMELVQGISSKQESSISKLTEEILEEEKEIFDKFYKNIK